MASGRSVDNQQHPSNYMTYCLQELRPAPLSYSKKWMINVEETNLPVKSLWLVKYGKHTHIWYKYPHLSILGVVRSCGISCG